MIPQLRRVSTALALLLSMSAAHRVRAAAIVSFTGNTLSTWPASWTPLGGVEDAAGDSTIDERDLIGNSSFATISHAADDSFVYFQTRINLPIAPPQPTDWNGSFFVLIDKVGYGTAGVPDYSFTWDSRQNTAQYADHALELQVLGSAGSTWGSVSMDDIDGDPSTKSEPDFVYGGPMAYGRTIDGQPNPGLGEGSSTLIQYAVAWSHLETYTELRRSDTWRVQAAWVDNRNDHGTLVAAEDFAGGVTSGTSLLHPSAWSEPFLAVPEPRTVSTCMGVMLLSAAAVVRAWRRRCQALSHGRTPPGSPPQEVLWPDSRGGRRVIRRRPRLVPPVQTDLHLRHPGPRGHPPPGRRDVGLWHPVDPPTRRDRSDSPTARALIALNSHLLEHATATTGAPPTAAARFFRF